MFLLLQVLFITGLVLLLSTASTSVRDVKHLIEIGVNILFWTTPIIYEASMIPGRFQRSRCSRRWRRSFAPIRTSSTTAVVPSPIVWAVAAVYAAGTFICGLSVFLAYEDRFSDYL